MGLFSGIKSTFKKSEAAVVVQNLLEHQLNSGLSNLDPPKTANKFVELIWDIKPDLFNGKFGQRPHKISVAAAALAHATQLFDRNDSNCNAVVISLGNVLSEIEVNGRLYPLNSLDELLIEEAMLVFAKIAQEFENSPLSKEVDEIMSYSTELSWEEWLKEFKKESGLINTQLKLDENGGSMIDFIEHEPLQRAHKDGVNPKVLAAEFASQFDITTFGQ
ncbi:hypothetical protein [Psychromonas sp.]|uniref:hypothetical protein n=1 Tax=Psychromonas sp. TaxID=1884585 RepID=UPI003A97CAD0